MPQQHQAQYVAQAAAIPYRMDRRTGRPEVLMIRRLDGGKWGLPKGLVDPGLSHPEAAEMEALQAAGMTPMEVISGATLDNAKFFRADARIGSIEPGKLADLVLVEGDVLGDINSMRQVRRVMLNGAWIR